MDAFRKRATETSELHASDPGAGAGKSRLLIEISSSRPDDMVGTETPRAALTSLSFILRNLGVFQAVLIGRGKFSEVYSGRDAEGRANGHAIKVAKDAASLVSIKEGQAGTEAYALHLGAMYTKSGGSSPFLSSSILLSGDKFKWMRDQTQKTTMADSSPQDFWVKYLCCSGMPSVDPAVLAAIDLVRGLLRADPAARLTCSAALAHPFLQRR
jgi:hypothetical protein